MERWLLALVVGIFGLASLAVWISTGHAQPDSFKPDTLFAALVALFTAMLWFSTDKLWRASVDQIAAASDSAKAAKVSADVAREALIASNRGWLKVKIEVGDQPLTFDNNGASFAVSISAENVGSSPALHVEARAWLLVWRSENSQDPYTEHERRCRDVQVGRAGFVMFPGDKYPAVANYGKMSLGIGLSQEEVAAGLKSSASGDYVVLLVGGCVSYTSAAAPDITHKSNFLYELRQINMQLPRPDAGSISPQHLFLQIAGFGEGNNAS